MAICSFIEKGGRGVRGSGVKSCLQMYILSSTKESTGNSVDAMGFVFSALNVKLKKFNQAQVKGGSVYDSLGNKTPVSSCHFTEYTWFLEVAKKAKNENSEKLNDVTAQIGLMES